MLVAIVNKGSQRIDRSCGSTFGSEERPLAGEGPVWVSYIVAQSLAFICARDRLRVPYHMGLLAIPTVCSLPRNPERSYSLVTRKEANPSTVDIGHVA